MLVFQGFLLSAITCLGVTCHCQSLYESALPHEPVVFPWESIVYICFDSLIKYRMTYDEEGGREAPRESCSGTPRSRQPLLRVSWDGSCTHDALSRPFHSE